MYIQQTIFKWIMIGLAVLLAGCSAGKAIIVNDRIYHAFTLNTYEFDGKAGSNRVEILDYLYGNPNGYAARNPAEYKTKGSSNQGYDNLHLNMPRNDLKIFYIKWLDNAKGEVHAVTLDLPKKLPRDFGENHRFFASFKQGQLYVYVITPERRADHEPPQGPRAYDDLKMLLLYPEQNNKRN